MKTRTLIIEAGRRAIAGALSLAISGLAPAAASLLASARALAADQGETQLAAIVASAKGDSVTAMLALQKAMIDARASGAKSLGSLAGPASEAHAALGRLREALQGVASAATQTERDAQLYFSVVVAYYGFVGLLDTAYQAAQDSGSAFGPVPTDLDLTVPAKAADALVRFKSQQAKQAGLPVYQISWNVTDAGGGAKTLALDAAEASRYRLGAFMAFPSEQTAKSDLRFEALKLVLANQALMNSDLFSDEKVPIELPAGTDPLLVSTRNQADLLAEEGAYRDYVTTSLVAPLSDAIAKARPDFASAAHRFYETVAERLASRVDLARLAKFAPSGVVTAIKTSKGDAKLAALKSAGDAVADKFLTVEAQQRSWALTKALKGVPGYLSIMSSADLRAALTDAVRVAESSLAIAPIEKAMMSVDELQPAEQALVFSELSRLLETSLDANALPEMAVQAFLKSAEDTDVMASFRRYDFAQKLIAAADWLAGAKGVLDKLSEADDVPPSMLPEHPDVGMTLLAYKPAGDNVPSWVLELMQSVGSKAGKTDKDDALRLLMGIVESTPMQLLDSVREANMTATDPVIGALHDEYSSRQNNPGFAWQSLTAKMSVIAQSTKTPGARVIMLDLLRVIELSNKTGASSLLPAVREAFDSLTKDRSARGLEKLQALISSGKSSIDQSHDFVQAVFSPRATRDAFLRKLLTNANVFRSYVGIHVQDIQSALPILFQPMKLSARGIEETGNPNPINFSDVVSRLKTAISVANADVSLGQNVIGAITPAFIRRTPLAQVVTSSVTPESLLASALSGTRDDPSLSDKALDFVIDKLFDRKSVPVAGDPMWPTEFRMRDLLPAYFDEGTPPAERARRVTVAALLTPYLRGSALNGAAEATTLLNPKLDPTKALVQSEAYRILSADVGDEGSDGLSDVQKKALAWKNRWDAVKRVTAKTQSVSNIGFYETMFLDIPAGGQLAANLFMALSSAVDFTSDIGLFVDYVTTYSDMKPFAGANALGHGLISAAALQGVNQEVHQMASTIANESIMDIWFYVSIGVDVKRAVSEFVAQRRYGSATKNVDQSQLSKDIESYSSALEDVGLDLKTAPAQIKTMAEAKEKELGAKAATEAGAKAELDRWVRVKQAAEDFQGKYGALLDQLEKPAAGK